MKIKRFITFFLSFLNFSLIANPSNFAKPIEIEMWHAFDGFLNEKFQEIADDFNHQSGQYKIIPIYKGNYKEVLDKGIEAFRNGHPPAILQVYEVATQTMMLNTQFFLPVDELMKRYYKKFDPEIYIDAVREFYSKENQMGSLPWNASTGVLFYNKRIFKEAGLDPEKPPKTWQELEEYGEKIRKQGVVGFVTAWPAAYHLELLCSWHNLPFATNDNGFKGLSSRLCFNGPYQIRHLEKLVEWQKKGIFKYQGRFSNEPETFFTEGKSAILLQGANRLENLKKHMKDEIGVGFLPYWSDIEGVPYNLNIGGSSFWAIVGHTDDVYRGVMQFFSFLSLPEIQAYWHQKTGYLPITEAAYYLSQKKGFYEKNKAAEIAVLEVMSRKPTAHTKGIRLGNYATIREKIIDYLEKALAQEISAKDALDLAVKEGNLLLEEFESTHK